MKKSPFRLLGEDLCWCATCAGLGCDFWWYWRPLFTHHGVLADRVGEVGPTVRRLVPIGLTLLIVGRSPVHGMHQEKLIGLVSTCARTRKDQSEFPPALGDLILLAQNHVDQRVAIVAQFVVHATHRTRVAIQEVYDLGLGNAQEHGTWFRRKHLERIAVAERGDCFLRCVHGHPAFF